MDDTIDYLDKLARTTSDVKTATIETRNDDQTYMVRYIATRALDRAAKANPVDEFSIGSRVLVQLPSASRNVVGALPVIVSRAPREQRGLSGSDPNDNDETFPPPPTIFSVDPDPLILIAGGDGADQTIKGVGFTTTATYAAGDDEPSLTNIADPDFSETQIVMHVAADDDSAVGDFDVAVGDLSAPGALRIIKKLPSPEVGQSLWAVTGNGNLYALNLDDLSVKASLGGSEVFSGGMSDILAFGSIVVAVGQQGLLKADAATGERLDDVTGFEDMHAFANSVKLGDALIGHGADSGSNSGKFYEFGIDGSGMTLRNSAPPSSLAWFLDPDGDDIWIADAAGEVVRYTRSSDSAATLATVGAESFAICHDADYVYVIDYFSATVRKIEKATGAVAAESEAVGSSGGFVAMSGDSVLALAWDGSIKRLAIADMSTLASGSVPAVSGPPKLLVGGNGFVYVPGYDPSASSASVFRIVDNAGDPADLTLDLTMPVLDPPEPDYAFVAVVIA